MAQEAIVRLRKEIWALENRVVFPVPRGVPPRLTQVPVFNPDVLAEIREKKREVLEWALMRFQASRRDRDSLPIAIDGSTRPMTSIQDWWRSWERHKPGFVADALASTNPWTRLRIGVTGPGNGADILEGSVPAAPSTTEF